jgi:hypothetical protein
MKYVISAISGLILFIVCGCSGSVAPLQANIETGDQNTAPSLALALDEGSRALEAFRQFEFLTDGQIITGQSLLETLPEKANEPVYPGYLGRDAQFIICSEMTPDQFRIWFGTETVKNSFPANPEFWDDIYCGLNGVRYRCSSTEEWQFGGIKAALENCWSDDQAEATANVFCFLGYPVPGSFDEWDGEEIDCQ